MPIRKGYHNILTLENEIYQYSGYNPELFIQAYNYFDLMVNSVTDPDIASNFLYKGIDTLYDFLFFVPDGHLLHYEVDSIAVLGEEMILKESLNSKRTFYPRYLNNKI